ncbi:MAG TPA: hypothetical protein VEI07_19840 [Planctomycetaceae bacterium]|nr:hypothetical protein [Planctomycetaceae bacterium]
MAIKRVQILDLDGSLADPSSNLPAKFERIAAQDWGPQIRLACTFGRFNRFQGWLSESMPQTGPALTAYGSGDFHHVTLALLMRIREPFNLMILDKHPDWMRGIPFLHCGTWLWHALQLPMLRHVFHCGGEADFDNGYRWLAPWSDIKSGRVVCLPAQRKFSRGGWASVPGTPLLQDGLVHKDRLRETLEPFRAELAAYPLYISIDKDVLVVDDAVTNWDSGVLRTADAMTILEAFLEAAGGRMIGADSLGDWSPVRLDGWLNRLCDWFDRRHRRINPIAAAETNAATNAALCRVLLSSSA